MRAVACGRRDEILAARERPLRMDRARLILEERTCDALREIVEADPLGLLGIDGFRVAQRFEQARFTEPCDTAFEALDDARAARLRERDDEAPDRDRFHFRNG